MYLQYVDGKLKLKKSRWEGGGPGWKWVLYIYANNAMLILLPMKNSSIVKWRCWVGLSVPCSVLLAKVSQTCCTERYYLLLYLLPLNDSTAQWREREWLWKCIRWFLFTRHQMEYLISSWNEQWSDNNSEHLAFDWGKFIQRFCYLYRLQAPKGIWIILSK